MLRPLDRLCRLSLFVLLLACVACTGRAPSDRVPAPTGPARAHNAAWLGVEWVMALRDATEIAALAANLEAHQIDTVYVYASYLRADGSFNPTYDHASHFVRMLAAAYPECSIQAWIGLPLSVDGVITWAGYVDLMDTDTRAQIAAFCASLVAEHGFHGVHLDPEPVFSGSKSLMRLLDEIRQALGPDATLSVAGRHICPWGARLSPRARHYLEEQLYRWFWSPAYYREVAARVDEIAVMVYDSSTLTPGGYRRWTRRQVVRVSEALAEANVRLFIGVPTSEERTSTHHPWAENMRSGLLGVREGLMEAGTDGNAVTGVAIYPYWETDEIEWSVYGDLWR